MSLTEGTIMGSFPHNRSDASATCFGLAVAAALKRRHPDNAAKLIAQRLSADGPECTIRTAENILQGHLSARTITRLVDAYGLALLLEAAGVRQGRSLDEVLEQFIEENAAQARQEQAAWGERVGRYQQQLGRLRGEGTRTSSADRKMAGSVVQASR
jgi:hypothetical protein